MVKKRVVKKVDKKSKKIKPLKISVEKQIEDFGKDVVGGVEEVEQWVIERKRFLVKLGWVVVFITVLLIVSHFCLRVKGFG